MTDIKIVNSDTLPENVQAEAFSAPNFALFNTEASAHKPRILLLYGSLRERSFSRLVVEESARILQAMGAETRIFNPQGLPLPDGDDTSNPKVAELRELMMWSEGQVWCSPERHGSMTGILKSQIDWVPLSVGAVRPTQGKTLAVMQVSVCMYGCMYACVCMYACMHAHMYVCVYVCIYVRTYVCMCRYVYVFLSVCLSVCLCVCMYVCMYVGM